jgi:Fe-S cluster assembly scaffold protein SufB
MQFYLLSRGLDAETAQALLEWAFVEDAITGMEPVALRSAAERGLAASLGNHVARQLLQDFS